VISLTLDITLAVLVVAVGLRTLSERDLFAASVTFIAFGLVLSLVWVRLSAPDVALAEAALGAGITGVLLVDAARELSRPPRGESGRERGREGTADDE
jgi:energy-converting hydrogenase B subunit D